MMRKYLALLCGILCLLTLAGCVSPFREVDQVGEYTPEIDPQAGNRSGGTITADLWLPVKSRDYFAVKPYSVSVASGERPEMAVLKELSRQQEPGDILVAAMWSSLQVLEVTDDNQTIYVTLSKEFLSPPTTDENERAAMCRAAVLSIANTLLGMGEYSQVQILVEMPASGKVQRPTRGQAGFLGADEGTVLGLLTAQPQLILTPETAVEIAMRAASGMDSLVLYDILYRYGGKMPDIFTFQSVLQGMPEAVKEYEIVDYVQEEEDRATVYVDILFEDGQGQERLETRVPLVCGHENGIWKVEYQTFEKLVIR
jgi:hypothetical protein